MSRAAWSCACCDTNNGASADECRNCGAERSVAGGAVTRDMRTPRRVHETGELPAFVESKHTTAARHVEPPAGSRVRISGSRRVPPPVSPPRTGPPPVPDLFRPARERPRLTPGPPPPVHRPSPGSGRAARRVIVWLLVILVAVAVVLANWSSVEDLFAGDRGGPPSTTEPVATDPPCPSEVAQWLPDSGREAVLEEAFVTPRHTITLCRTASGGLYYDGQVTGAPVTSETHLSVPAVSTGSGYVADNGSFRYEIVGTEVIVYRDGTVYTRQPLTRIGP